MFSSPDSNYIDQVLMSNEYKDLTTTKEEIITALQIFKGLQPFSDRYFFNNGTQKTLLGLIGTIPIRYRGSTFNIPVVIWLMDTHPVSAPMVFVKPTPDMRIKVSKHIDNNGRIYSQYLHEWKSSNSHLLGLIKDLVDIFSEQPPVFYAVSPGSQPPVMPPFYGTPCAVTTPFPPPMPMPSGSCPVAAAGNDGQLPKLEVVTAAVSTPFPVSASKNYKNRLIFPDGEDLKDILVKVTPGLVAAMGSKEVNQRIVLQLLALGHFDAVEVHKIKTFNYNVESERMSELFDVIMGTDDEGILDCLEKICNLDDLPVASRKYRNIINRIYHGSVQPV